MASNCSAVSICGAAASTGKTVVVDDVSKDPRYLACSLETKSEIVVPIFIKGKVAGELDIVPLPVPAKSTVTVGPVPVKQTTLAVM